MAQILFATQADIDAAYPRELGVLSADERTRQIDSVRVAASLSRASGEVRQILAGRFAPDDLTKLDEDGFAALRGYAIDIALYYVSLSFARTSETIKERYTNAIKRLEAIATGKGGLTFMTLDGVGGALTPPSNNPVASLPAHIHPNEPVVLAPPRLFGRERSGGWI
jgi:phage gp36-like protein